jgi:hypothetical protein
VQRSYIDIHHYFSLKYFDWYAAELAWRGDTRDWGNRRQTFSLLRMALARPVSASSAATGRAMTANKLVQIY